VLAAPGFAGWLLALLLTACAYAAFASGAIDGNDAARLEVGVAAAAVAGGVGLGAGILSWGRAPLAWTGVALLGLFALWSAVSIGWSVAPDETWLAVNRTVAYVAVTALALVAAAALRQAPRIAATAIAVIALFVALYALGGKLAPGIHLGGIDLNQTDRFQRLREPIGYWNALGLLCVFGTPACIWAAADRGRRDGVRVGALLSLVVLLATVALTYSRGAMLAYLAVVVVLIAGGPDRLRRAVVALAAAAAAAPSIALAFTRHDLTTEGLSVSQRTDDGLILTAVLLATLVGVAVLAAAVLRAERTVRWTPARTRRVARALVAFAVICALGGIVALASSQRGVTGTIAHQWREFKRVKGTTREPGHLVSVNGSNRWIWWSEAAGAFSDKPVAGWGAGSFPTLHYLYRRHEAPVRSTHSVELELLSETGLVGAALGVGGLALLGLAAARGARRAVGPDRAARLALVAVFAAWAVHSTYDWDWEIPAVTLPALVAAAVAAMPIDAVRRPGELMPSRRRAPEPPGWLLGAAAGLVAICLALSAVLPALSESRRLDSLVHLSNPATLRKAEAEADLSRRLNPLSVASLLNEAEIASLRHRPARREQLLFRAAQVQPDNYRVWEALTMFLGGFDAPRLEGRALRRWSELDPLSFRRAPGEASLLSLGAALTNYVREVPPARSPTAYGTPPLPPKPGPAPPAPSRTP
jgi:O-antigen ligase